MNKPISTFDKICETATYIFATHGYDATSLSMIAESVGIRKASLYSHFESKNELFSKLFLDAYRIESSFMENCYKEKVPEGYVGENYCKVLPSRFESSAYLKLFLRASFIAPDFIQCEVKQAYKTYLKKVSEYFIDDIQEKYTFLNNDEILMFSEAYLGIIDSLHVELIYSNYDDYERKRISMLSVLSKAIALS